MKGARKKLLVTLIGLGWVFFMGTQSAHAWILPVLLVGGGLDLLLGGPFRDILGGLVGDIATGIAQGIAAFLGYLIQALSGVFFYIANATIEFAINLNTLITSDVNVVLKEGFSVSLTIANLGLVIGIVIMAFAIMTRAQWLVEARSALPKFLTAAILINFSYFMQSFRVIF